MYLFFNIFLIRQMLFFASGIFLSLYDEGCRLFYSIRLYSNTFRLRLGKYLAGGFYVLVGKRIVPIVVVEMLFLLRRRRRRLPYLSHYRCWCVIADAICCCYLLLLLLFLIAFDGTTDAAGDDSDSNVDLCQYNVVMVLVASSYNYSYYLIEFDLCRGIRWHLKSYSAYWLIVSSNLTNWIKFKTKQQNIFV